MGEGENVIKGDFVTSRQIVVLCTKTPKDEYSFEGVCVRENKNYKTSGIKHIKTHSVGEYQKGWITSHFEPLKIKLVEGN